MPESLTDEAIQVLRQAFDDLTGIEEFRPKYPMLWPDFTDVAGLAQLLVGDPNEEALQAYLRDHPALLLGAVGDGDDTDLAFLPKPRIGGQFVADFALLKYSQGGCTIRLVEIEPSSEPLFTAAGTPARRFQSAIGQVHDWGEWISRNLTTFVRDTIDAAVAAPEYPTRAPGGSFILRDADSLQAAWRAFGGFDHPRIRYSIVVGRWGLLSNEHRQRLIYWNQQNWMAYETRTFDQIIRRGLSRPFIRNY